MSPHAELVEAVASHKPCADCGNVLGPHDVIGITFYVACNGMLAFAAFFFVQASVVSREWKTSTSVAGLVCITAWYNYTFMRQQWIETQSSPTVYRYTDWLITVPLQIAEFYFILSAAGPVSSGLGFRLFSTSVMMIMFGWLAEIDVMAKLVGFSLGMACWLYILYEVFAGSAAECASRITSAAARQAFGTLRLIVSVGWSIYPIGFAIAYLCKFDQPAGDESQLAMGAVNGIYNLADFINKGAFGLCVWTAAMAATKNEAKGLL
jgi:bacteriorhodopsin